MGHCDRRKPPRLIPISFAGGLLDPDTGFIRFGARDYDPALGRWTDADPVRFAGQDANLYRYAAADPVNRTDRRGLDSTGTGSLGDPMPLGPPDKGITPFLPTGPGTPIGGWRRPGGGAPDPDPPPSAKGDCDWESAAGIGALGGDLPPPCIPVPPPQDPGGGGNPGPGGNPGQHGHQPIHCVGFWCFGPDGPTFCWTCVFGDPHLEVANRRHIDFQAAGEFLAAASPNGKLEIQSRQEAVLGGTEITFNTAVAANVAGDHVGVYAKEPSHVLVNGIALELPDVEARLPHGGRLQRHGGIVNLIWPDGTQLNIVRFGQTLNFDIAPPRGGTLVLSGLLGNSGKANDLVGRDGSTLSPSDPAFQSKLYRQFGNSWRLKPSESLFHYWPGESSATFTRLDIPSKEVRASSLPSQRRAEAEQVCRATGVRMQPGLDDCMLDVGITGIPALASAVVGAGLNTLPGSTATANATAAEPVSVHNFSIHIGDTVSPNHPATGAGIVSQAGEQQSYSFEAQAGDHIYFAAGPCEAPDIRYTLLQPGDKALDGRGSCGDFGPVTLPAAGTYKLVVAPQNGPAHYSFTLRRARFDRFGIAIGDSVSPDHPAKGAGSLSDLGQRQSYEFTGRAGEAVYIAAGVCEGGPTQLSILRPDNVLLEGNNCHSDIGRVELPANGNYSIVAASDRPNVAAQYGFSLRSIPADQHFSVGLPFAVSRNKPAGGAGRITAPGQQQFFEFTAPPHATVHIEGTCASACPKLSLRVVRGDEHVDFRYGAVQVNNLKWDVTLPPGSKYTIQVRSMGYVGEYGFKANIAKP